MPRSPWTRNAVVCCLGLLIASTQAQSSWLKARVVATTPSRLQALMDSGVETVSCEPGLGLVDAILGPGDEARLKLLGLSYWVTGWMPDPYDWGNRFGFGMKDDYRSEFFNADQIMAFFEQLRAQSPLFVTRIQIATSHNGEAIFAYRFGRPLQIGGTPENNLVILGLQHAREWISGSVVMHAAKKLKDGFTTPQPVPFLVNKAVWIVPITNPDGYRYTWSTDRFWRKNRRDNGSNRWGVDLNRNWAKGWGGAGSSGDPNSEIYRGPSAFSEPEDAGVRNLVLSLRRVGGLLDIHSAAGMVLWPWGYTTDLPPTWQMLESVAIDIRNAMSNNGFSYQQGEGSRILYVASGVSRDWFYDGWGVPAYTVEMRDLGYGFTPPTSEIIPSQDEAWLGILAMLNRIPS